ncbi:MAG: esterase-like activity of phytase family protein [Candidatus Contendobacter sp.]|nr:esterase-like activity of phytase family protein [Candidatus Contendobacter sp.]
MPCLIVLLVLVLGLPASGCVAREFKATPITLTDQVGLGDTYAGIRLLGALRLNDASIGGLRLCGLSGLAWDENAGLLYALSDEGRLFHLRPEFDAHGYLIGAQLVAGYPLRDENNRPLRSLFNDSESLAIRKEANRRLGNTELVISFEEKPRVVRYSSTGQWRGEEILPSLLRDIRNYHDPNQAIESVTLDPRWGVLVGSETPLRDDPTGQVRIFTRDGRFWTYPLSKAPNSALVDMTTLPDGGLLTLERAFVNPLRPLIISLRRTEPLPAPGTAQTLLNVTDVAVFDSGQGWLLDNFEGLTHHRDQRFFMVSDDNCHTWQATLLMYFELRSSPHVAMPEAVDKD